MEALNVIGLIASIVSIVSAFIALFSVSKVKKAKNEIFLKLRIMKNSEFLSLNRSILSQLKQITTSKKIPIGTNFEKIIEVLLNYYEELSRLSQNVNEKSELIEIHLKTLKEKINTANTLDRKKDTSKIVELYTEIYYYLIEIEKDILKINNGEIEK